ncbi:hypothetical protein DPEC_G00371440 [Dallia pectoralis]|nr:hypothetical protein DPEC_G00371440 [Dallia pectoralis]
MALTVGTTLDHSKVMSDHKKMLLRPLFRRDVNWDPFCEWTQPHAHDHGARLLASPPFLDEGMQLDKLGKKETGSILHGQEYTRSGVLIPGSIPPDARGTRTSAKHPG